MNRAEDIRCERCNVVLAEMYDFAHGGERSQVVCFSCDPPMVLCPACARLHSHGRPASEERAMDVIPPWAQRAARELYRRMESIEAEAMSRGQVEQDSEAERSEWTRLVAEVIAAEFHRRCGHATIEEVF